MFKDGIRPEPLPERIYYLCKLIEEKNVSSKELGDMMEPTSFDRSSSYFSDVFRATKELGLITINDKGQCLLNFDKKNIVSLDEFRYYLNSYIWKDRNSLFYKMAAAFLYLNDFVCKESITSGTAINKIQSVIEGSKPDNITILGERFWLTFLGLGYNLEENKKNLFIPNMYVALKDFIKNANLERNKEYTIREFVECIKKVSSVAFEYMNIDETFNLAFSNALRTLHDKKEIILKKNPDSKEVWKLYHSSIHPVGNNISHILILEDVQL